MKTLCTTVSICSLLLAASYPVRANVLNMGGTQSADGSWTGLASLEFVTVGNPGNPADMRYNLNGSLGRPEGYGAVPYAYRMGEFEITAGQYTEFLNAVAGKADTYGLYHVGMSTAAIDRCNITQTGSWGSYTYSVPADWANRPVTWVSWGDAARFANWLANGQPTGRQDLTTTENGSYYLNGATSNTALIAVTRKPGARYVIPSEDEWYKAAFHKNDGVTGNYWNFATGSDTLPSNVLANPDPGNTANCYGGGFSYTIGSPYGRTPVGEFENSASPYGTFDQDGNAWEWNETAVAGSFRGIRGGSFFDLYLYLNANTRQQKFPSNENHVIGFRIAEVPEPCSLALLAIGGVVAARCRRRRMHAP